jgi:hypothetical protein
VKILLTALSFLFLVGSTSAAEKHFSNGEALSVGAWGKTDHLYGKVIQILDANSMIVGIKDAETGTFPTLILVKYKTQGLTDGFFFLNNWSKIVGGNEIKVTGTKTLKLAGGGTRTMFVVEPRWSEAEKEKARAEAKKEADKRAEGVRAILAERERVRKAKAERIRKAKEAARVKEEERKEEDQREDPTGALRTERSAQAKLKLIKRLIDDDLKDKASLRLEQLVKQYPQTKAAAEARKLLKELGN